MPADDQSTRDLVIDLRADVRILIKQVEALIRLETRMLECEKLAAEARDHSTRMTWIGGVSLAFSVTTAIGLLVKVLAK